MTNLTEDLRRHEIPGRVIVGAGHGGLARLAITSAASTAEIYLQGAHITHFQKTGESPLLFISRHSWFEPGKPIRGGVPICFPWFGTREGEPSHGFARLTDWHVSQTSVAPDGTVTVRFVLPTVPGREAWNALRTEFVVTVAESLTMELTTTNAGSATVEIERCLHTYVQVGDISTVSVTGLRDAPFNDFATGPAGPANPAIRHVEHEAALRIGQETNRVYFDHTGPVDIHDQSLGRDIRVEKINSRSTVVWNPWTTQTLPDDFDPVEYTRMVCVESGDVKQNRISLGAGQTTTLTVVLRAIGVRS